MLVGTALSTPQQGPFTLQSGFTAVVGRLRCSCSSFFCRQALPTAFKNVLLCFQKANGLLVEFWAPRVDQSKPQKEATQEKQQKKDAPPSRHLPQPPRRLPRGRASLLQPPARAQGSCRSPRWPQCSQQWGVPPCRREKERDISGGHVMC